MYCPCFILYSIRPVYGAQHPPRVEKPAERMEHGTPKRHVQQRDSFQDFQVKNLNSFYVKNCRRLVLMS